MGASGARRSEAGALERRVLRRARCEHPAHRDRATDLRRRLRMRARRLRIPDHRGVRCRQHAGPGAGADPLAGGGRPVRDGHAAGHGSQRAPQVAEEPCVRHPDDHRADHRRVRCRVVRLHRAAPAPRLRRALDAARSHRHAGRRSDVAAAHGGGRRRRARRHHALRHLRGPLPAAELPARGHRRRAGDVEPHAAQIELPAARRVVDGGAGRPDLGDGVRRQAGALHGVRSALRRLTRTELRPDRERRGAGSRGHLLQPVPLAVRPADEHRQRNGLGLGDAAVGAIALHVAVPQRGRRRGRHA